MIFRQLFDPETSTYTYLLADADSRACVLIDSVREQLERDVTLIRELQLELILALETHVHADHVTASGALRRELGAKIAAGEHTGVSNADRYLADGEIVTFGAHELEVRHTPGHTNGCVSYVCHEAGVAFTGDALLVRGCGRTDFQEGSAATLFHSVRERIFSLPDEFLLYPGHDYKGRTVTSVAEEKRVNARLALDKSEAEFVAIMAELKLAHPKRIDIAVPGNLTSGEVVPEPPAERAEPGSVAVVMEQLGRQDTEMSMGLGI